ncbi:MAG: hypothetical protein ACUZ77_00760 [Candidatus Brocadiales bacterium]
MGDSELPAYFTPEEVERILDQVEGGKEQALSILVVADRGKRSPVY